MNLNLGRQWGVWSSVLFGTAGLWVLAGCIPDRAPDSRLPQPPAGRPGPFGVRAFHVSLHPESRSMDWYHELIDDLAGRGYTMLVISLGGEYAPYAIPTPGSVVLKRCTAEELKGLFVHARRAGLEPVMEIKVLSKQQRILAQLAEQHPGLLVPGTRFRAGLLNAGYKFPDGREAFAVIDLAMIQWGLDLIADVRPRYWLLGCDEIPVDQLAAAAKPMGLTAAELLAQCLNRATDLLLERGITPIIWGDMLLSPRLALPGHGVVGFDHDPRFARLAPTTNPLYAEFLSETGVSTVTAMNHLRHREQIVVADWYYGPQEDGEFPSVDYFQAMGFKDVWGATWFTEENIAQFSRYAAARKCGGMMATSWHTSFSSPVRHLFYRVLNSIVYFSNPEFTPPAIAVSYRMTGGATDRAGDQEHAGVFQAPPDHIVLEAPIPPEVVPEHAVARVVGNGGGAELSTPLTFDVQSHSLRGDVRVPGEPGEWPQMFDLDFHYEIAASGYLVQKLQSGALVIAAGLPPGAGDAATGALYLADFSKANPQDMAGRLFTAPGRYGGAIFLRGPTATREPAAGALDCTWANAVYGYPDPRLWEAIQTEGMNLAVEFQVQDASPQKDWAALLSYGHVLSGFRVLIDTQRRMALFGKTLDDAKPFCIVAPGPVPPGQWNTLRLAVSPPDAQGKRTASIQVNQDKPVTTTMNSKLVQPDMPIGFGVQFNPHLDTAVREWLAFPGLIRKVEIALPAASANVRQTEPAPKSKLALFPADMQRYLPTKMNPVKVPGLAAQVHEAFASGEQYWTAVGPGCVNVPMDIVIRGERIYLQTDWGLHRSDDGGAHWRSIAYTSPGGLDEHPQGMDVSPEDEAFIVVAGRGLFRSYDGGKSWAQSDRSFPDRFGLFRQPRFNCDGSRIFVGLTHTLLDGGEGVATGDFAAKLIFVSADKAETFRAFVLDSTSSSAIRTVCAHPANPDVVFFSFSDGELFLTRNARVAEPAFERVATPEGYAVAAMAIDPAQPDNLLATLDELGTKATQAKFCRFRGVMRGTIDCEILPLQTADGTPIVEPNLVSLGINPNTPSNIVIGMHYHKRLQMLISDDYGKAFRYWTMPATLFGGNWFECAVEAIRFGKNSPMSVINSPVCAWISRDNLQTLTPLNTYDGKWYGNRGVAGLAHTGSLFLTDSCAYICALDHFLYRSDGKDLRKWEWFSRLTRNGLQVSPDNKYVYILPSDPKNLYGSKATLMRLAPGTPTDWLDVTCRLGPEFANAQTLGGFLPALKAVFNPANSAEHWLLLGNGIFYTSDGGTTFAKVGGNMTQSRISALAYDEKRDVLYLGYGVGACHEHRPLDGVKPLHRSLDKGQTWEAMDMGINNVESIAVAANGNVIVGTALSPEMPGELIVLRGGDAARKEVRCTIGDTAEELSMAQVCFDLIKADGNDVLVIANRKHVWGPPYPAHEGALGPLLSTDGGNTFKWIRHNLPCTWIMSAAIKDGLVMIGDSAGLVAHKFRNSQFTIEEH